MRSFKGSTYAKYATTVKRLRDESNSYLTIPMMAKESGLSQKTLRKFWEWLRPEYKYHDTYAIVMDDNGTKGFKIVGTD